MNHLFFFCYIVSFSASFLGITVVSIIYIKTHRQIFARYIRFALCWTLELFITTTNLYVIEFFSKRVSWILYTTLILRILLTAALLQTTPAFFHSLLRVPERWIRKCFSNITAAIPIVVVVISFFIGNTLEARYQFLNRWYVYIARPTIVIIDLYMFILFFYYLFIGRKKYRIEPVALQLAGLTLLFTPMFIYQYIRCRDHLQNGYYIDHFYWLVWNLLIVIHARRYFQQEGQVKPGAAVMLKTDGSILAIPDQFFTEYNLTEREVEVIKLLFIKYSNQEIAEALFISLATVKTHVSNILKKTDTANRNQLLKLVQSYAMK